MISRRRSSWTSSTLRPWMLSNWVGDEGFVYDEGRRVVCLERAQDSWVIPLRFDGSWLFPWFDIFALLHGVWRGAGCNHGWLMESLA